MYKKVCPFCKGVSYSSYNGKWICPYCNNDITIVMKQCINAKLTVKENNFKKDLPEQGKKKPVVFKYPGAGSYG